MGRSSTPSATTCRSLRILGSVGEPINPEAWIWYRTHIGGDRCPVVDTWWQTETGNIMIRPLPGVTTLKPGSATKPLPGVTADVVNSNGESVPLGQGGYLVLREPWPGMLRTLYGDDDRFVETYWSTYPGLYLAGDGARRDADGDYWLLGRIDDVMNVSGHRLSTIEIESALVDHPKVAEAAVVGRTDETTGQAIAAFVTLKGHVTGDEALIAELRQHVATKIGAIARPKSIVLTDDLPKTRSGKIMRRLLRDISEDRQLGDVTTLANEEVVRDISDMAAPRARPARRSSRAQRPGGSDRPVPTRRALAWSRAKGSALRDGARRSDSRNQATTPSTPSASASRASAPASAARATSSVSAAISWAGPRGAGRVGDAGHQAAARPSSSTTTRAAPGPSQATTASAPRTPRRSSGTRSPGSGP